MQQGPPGGYNPPPGGYGGPPGGYGGPPGGYGGPPAGPPPGGYGPPPGGYGGPPMPYGGFPPPPGPLAPGGGVGNLAAFTQREAVTLLLLTIVTCGIYGLVWKYQTTEELRQATGDDTINPMLDVILPVLTCGVWTIYTHHRNAKKIFELAQRAGVPRTDQSTTVILCDIFGLALVASFILQGEYNALAQAAQGRQLTR